MIVVIIYLLSSFFLKSSPVIIWKDKICWIEKYLSINEVIVFS